MRRMEHPSEIATENPEIVLRQLTEADDEAYAAAIATIFLHPFGGEIAMLYPNADAVRYQRLHPVPPDKLMMGIWADSHLVGGANMMPVSARITRLGWWVGMEHMGQGLATLVAQAMTSHALDAGFEQIDTWVHPENVVSLHIVKKQGFVEVERKLGWTVLSYVGHQAEPA